MYAGGSEHPNKAIAEQFLLRVAENEIEAAIGAEVLQEILHRYISTQRWALGKRVYSVARSLFPDVLPITAAVMDQARDFVAATPTSPPATPSTPPSSASTTSKASAPSTVTSTPFPPSPASRPHNPPVTGYYIMASATGLGIRVLP